ncbi:hypothetical protein EBZ80_12945 [bacterium]|nr:hypothetical protein [bacterium]
MSDFGDAFALCHAAAREAMGETITLPDDQTIIGIVEAPEVSLGRVAFGGKADPTTGTIIVSAEDWAETGYTDGVIVQFRGLEARVMSTVPGHGDRLELRLQPINLFDGV